MTRNLTTATLFGLVALGAACGKTETPTSPSPTAPNTNIYYTAIGASDGIGFGGSSPCLPFSDCPTGTGYVQTLRRRLAEGGRTVDHLNLSIPGSVLSKAVFDLAASVGRPIDSLDKRRKAAVGGASVDCVGKAAAGIAVGCGSSGMVSRGPM